MKKLILFICLCSFLSCKKDTVEDITKYNWVLTSATVTPAMTVNGKTSTDYIALSDHGGCLSNNFTLNFLSTGVYTVGSNGPLCDMMANTDNTKWKKDGNTVTMYNTSPTIYSANLVAEINGETLTYTTSVTDNNNVSHSVLYSFKAKSK